MTITRVLALAVMTTFLSFETALSQAAPKQPMRITIDVRDLPRKLLHAELIVPLDGPKDSSRKVALWYPKWVPGSHGPGGPIANVAGLKIEDTEGRRLKWVRSPGDVYRIVVDVPAGVGKLHIGMRYITDQPTTTSFGHDCFSARNIGVISPGCLLLYPETANIDRTQIRTKLKLPKIWRAATALPSSANGQSDESSLEYQAVSLRTLVDSPIMCGLHYRSYTLAKGKRGSSIPPHQLHVFGDESGHADLNPQIVKRWRKMVTQTARLIGSHPFDRFDILLGVSNELKANGLEHSRSTFNVLPVAAVRSPETLMGWNRLLIPHEYLHAWCGKYRRPAGMLTPDFHTPKDTELLWVYEGLTQYLGELVEARCGLMTADEFRHRLTVELRNAAHLQGRQWRTLADTGAASYTLRKGSPNWGGLRRSQDYYMEGMLFWMEADARIRQVTDGAKSLDDFCEIFLGATADAEHPKPFTRQMIVDQLQSVADYDWNGLISRRVESFQEQFDPSMAELLGYEFQMTDKPPVIPKTTFRHRSGVDAFDSLGVVFSSDGVVRSLRIGSEADRARLAPGMKIIGINGRTWSGPKLIAALNQAKENRQIDLMITSGDAFKTIRLKYDGGPRYWNLVRNKQTPDLLQPILKSKPKP